MTFSRKNFDIQIFLFYISQILLIPIVDNGISNLYYRENLQWPLLWINYIEFDLSLFLKFFIYCSFIVPIFLYKKRVIRFINFLGHLFLSTSFNIENITSNHSIYLYLYVSMFLIFLPKENADKAKWRQFYKCTLVLVLSPYFISGLQKVTMMGKEVFDKNILNDILIERLFISGESLLFPSVISTGTWLNYVFSYIVLFEILAISALLNRTARITYSILLILFHLLSLFVLNINFIPAIYIIFIFLVFDIRFKLFQNFEYLYTFVSSRKK